MKTDKNHKLIFGLLCFLFGFLPFSSWLVSLTGLAWISLVRDVAVFLMLILLVLSKKIKLSNKLMFSIALIFAVWGLCSFFWREASIAQWLKGYRFTYVPIFLFLILSCTQFIEKEKNILSKILLYSSVVVILFAVLELMGIKLPLTTSLSGAGALESNHVVGRINVARLGSVLAGPNALGLYLLAMVGFFLGSFGTLKKVNYLWILYAGFLLLTFSRSSVAGLIVMILTALFLIIRKKTGWFLAFASILFVLSLLSYGGAFLYTNEKTRDYLTHSDSTSMRFEQYERVWDTRNEIGLLGRGSGTAGPSSQYRLDGGENHWTENIYLDIFEELGLIGLILYLIIMLYLIAFAWKNKNQDRGKTALFITIAFAFSGIFINYYTGQAGIFLLWLASGLMMPGNSKHKENNG